MEGTRMPTLARVLAGAAVFAGGLAATLAVAHASPGAGAQVRVAKTSVGRILVTAQGRTLYLFAADRHGQSVCYGTCAAFWPPLLAHGRRVTGAGVKASLLGTTKRRDGKLQVTYAGHPLYRFLKDTRTGQLNGQGLDAAGGLWWVVSPAGRAITRTASSGTTTTSTTTTSTTTTTTSGGGYGYAP